MRLNLVHCVSLVVVAQSTFLGCTTGNCRQLGHAEAQSPAVVAPASSAADKATGTSAVPVKPAGIAKSDKGVTPPAGKADAKKPAVVENIIVYKYDGSLQCGMGKAIPVEDMGKELTAVGIRVSAREKKSDGLMHIQVCGQPTGMVNAFTIPSDRLKEAEQLGFRKWNFE